MIYVLSGGQTGATLTVTSSGAGTITVSNTSLGKSYSKSVTAGGSAVFKGLQTGTWTVKLSNGKQTSTKNITITSDYSTSIAYFSATISITYPAKSKCVVKNSSGTTVASNTNTGSSTKKWTATVNAKGTYTVTATATDGSGKSKSQSVSITADGQSKSVTLRYELTLYDRGDEFKDITGGWVMRGVGSIVKNTDHIAISSIPWGQNGWASTANMINLADISTIKFDVDSGSTYPIPGYPRIAITTNTSGIDFSDGTGMASSLTLAAGRTIRSMDVSSLSGSYYVTFGGYTGDDGEPNIVVYKVWGVPK